MIICWVIFLVIEKNVIFFPVLRGDQRWGTSPLYKVFSTPSLLARLLLIFKKFGNRRNYCQDFSITDNEETISTKWCPFNFRIVKHCPFRYESNSFHRWLTQIITWLKTRTINLYRSVVLRDIGHRIRKGNTEEHTWMCR